MAGMLGGIRINDQEVYDEALDMLLYEGHTPKIEVLDTTDKILMRILEKLDTMDRPKVLM